LTLEISVKLGHEAAALGNLFPTFRDHQFVSKHRESINRWRGGRINEWNATSAITSAET